jgi:hypothetical protein
VSEDSGVITFFSSSHAVHAEKVLKSAGYQVEMIPGPKDISPNCGVALRYDYGLTAPVETVLRDSGVTYEGCHPYRFKKEKTLLERLMGR